MEYESPVIKEVRERRMQISQEFGHDIRRYGQHLMELQQRPEHRDKLVTREQLNRKRLDALNQVVER